MLTILSLVSVTPVLAATVKLCDKTSGAVALSCTTLLYFNYTAVTLADITVMMPSRGNNNVSPSLAWTLSNFIYPIISILLNVKQ